MDRSSVRWIPSAAGFEKKEVALPKLSENEVLIDTAAFGVNRLDLELKNRPGALGADSTLGLEVSGTVAATGGRSDFRAGDRVMALVRENGYASRVIAPSETTLLMPDRLSFEQGAALPEALFTAWLNLFEIGALQAGESLLIHHASGGVGILGGHLAKALGASVRVTSRNPDGLKKLRAIGLEGISTEEFDRKPDFGEAFDLILDIRGADSFDANLRLLKTDGRLVLIDSYSGEEAKIDIGRLLDNRLSVHGSLLRPRSLAQKSLTAAGIRARALPLIDGGEIAPVIDQVLGADAIGAAHARLASNRHFGKIVVSLTA